MTITDLLTEHGIDFCPPGQHHHVRHGWLGLDCPLCSPKSKKWKLGISLTTLACSCWTCGVFRLDHVLADALNIPPQEAGQLATQLRGGRVCSSPHVPRGGKVLLPSGLGPLQPLHERYLERRGFDPEVVQKLWKVRGIGLSPRLAWRLFFPVTLDGETVSWTTRAVTDDVERRYIAARPGEEKVDAHTLLFGEDFCRHAVVVCEGPLDAIKIGPGGVATLGVKYTHEQVMRMARYPVRVVVFDNEVAAQRRARKLTASLSVYPGETHNVILHSGKDPSRASEREIAQLRKTFLE